MRKRRRELSGRARKVGIIVVAGVVVLAGSLFGALSACGKPSAQTTPPGTAGLFSDPDDSAHPRSESQKPEKKYELDARGKELLARVKEGDDADVSRFAAYVGAAGLIELSHADDTRAIALQAMEDTPGFSCAALLAETAKQGKDDDARIALRSLHAIAARPRRAVDMEDGAELAYACDTLLAISNDGEKKERADLATSVLRMLSAYGCAAPEGGAPAADAGPKP